VLATVHIFSTKSTFYLFKPKRLAGYRSSPRLHPSHQYPHQQIKTCLHFSNILQTLSKINLLHAVVKTSYIVNVLSKDYGRSHRYTPGSASPSQNRLNKTSTCCTQFKLHLVPRTSHVKTSSKEFSLQLYQEGLQQLREWISDLAGSI